MTTITFLGSGNAFCPSGRLHSLVLIDDRILVDAPPTVVPQMREHGICPSSITDLLITHWHGDHTFGVPFLLLERKWISERFEVCHNPLTEPHGYRFEKDNFILVHCGDSGPCDNIERLAPDADVMIIELGIPDYVDSPYHYTPSRLRDLAMRNPETIFLATHNFSQSGDKAELPDNVIEVEDGEIYNF